MPATDSPPLGLPIPPREAPAAVRTVVLVEDHELVRLGTALLLESLPGITCRVVNCRSLDEAWRECSTNAQIDLVLLDLNLCDAKGLQGLRVLREAFPSLNVAIITGTEDEFVIRQAQGMGAKGYLLKSWTPDQLRPALQSLLADPGDTLARSLDRFPRLTATNSFDRVAELGPRHLEILELVLSGCSNREIGTSTGLSIGTVKNYVSAILLALDVRSRSHLISLFH
jgi:DNA-binding NarL/FixJ family response regulator